MVLDCALHLLRGRSKGIAENHDAMRRMNDATDLDLEFVVRGAAVGW